ncbi:Phosphate transport system permease protein PstA [Paraconexibacter sp. AEG42_29]|uniref:Phosphate transport system permease protein PstA n=1 Tax=Paraconexibacter sp. AEG42_29 TaxID=2997339 RepID=A0AAU7AU46_9ACTN
MSTPAQMAGKAMQQTTVIPRRNPNDARKERGFAFLMYAAVAIAFISLAALMIQIASDGAGALSWNLLTNFPSKINPATSGVKSALYGTVYLMILTAIFVIPIGVGSAIYLEEYADRRRWFNRIIEVNIQNLASVPSVVYGLLGLAFVVRGPLSLERTLLAGAITLGLLVLPVVIIVAREAIRAVPPSIRDGSLALGATKWQTIWKQVLPGSMAGIATGVILALSRAIGETAPLIVIGAAVSPRFLPDGLNSEFTALPVQIFAFSKDSDPQFLQLASATIIVLMVLLLAMNSVAIYLRSRFEQKW